MNSYVHEQAKRELRLKARAQRRLRDAGRTYTRHRCFAENECLLLVLTSPTRPRGRM